MSDRFCSHGVSMLDKCEKCSPSSNQELAEALEAAVIFLSPGIDNGPLLQAAHRLRAVGEPQIKRECLIVDCLDLATTGSSFCAEHASMPEPRAADEPTGEPVAYVPVHPTNGPLWANTIASLDSDHPASYPVMPLYRRAEPPREWQPIETAPKDGTVVLLFRRVDPWNVIGYGHWEGGDPRTVFVSGWVTGGFNDPPGNLGLAAPSHWMPLPGAALTKPACNHVYMAKAGSEIGTGVCVTCGAQEQPAPSVETDAAHADDCDCYACDKKHFKDTGHYMHCGVYEGTQAGPCNCKEAEKQRLACTCEIDPDMCWIHS